MSHDIALSTREPTIELERLLTYRQAAEVLGVTERTVRTYVRAKALLSARFGRSVRIDPADLRTFIDAAKGNRGGGDL